MLLPNTILLYTQYTHIRIYGRLLTDRAHTYTFLLIKFCDNTEIIYSKNV